MVKKSGSNEHKHLTVLTDDEFIAIFSKVCHVDFGDMPFVPAGGYVKNCG